MYRNYTWHDQPLYRQARPPGAVGLRFLEIVAVVVVALVILALLAW